MNLNAKTYFSMAKENKELKKMLIAEQGENIRLYRRIAQLLTIIEKAMKSDDPKQAICDNYMLYEKEEK